MLFIIIYLVFLVCATAHFPAFINAHQPEQSLLCQDVQRRKHRNEFCSHALMCQ
ncbi:Boma7a [Bombyx mandarina nucleopolyhedrovirus]|uniref:BV/ODV-E26 n=2 Tax=Bombyx mori nuclear polyhedrosis virus TaxID=271108 RepID=O92383_NPVBM|nr:Orf_7a [Bombyx mori nucleopolyhedrovirus]ACQ57198.1 Boma7a [Bombyx mandarina nucleopolyhedrovirus]AFO09978.1 hypothetical protein Bomanpvs2gp008 [Bombyx mandarina nucleopolyhedrovirus S2]AAC63690.1 Orf_7a [Bombyx mori nucleopolyhedrovirus]AFN09070.1 hypothetical protein Bmnpvcubicgp008 [Bombyx mori nucleopolyhedrovirus]AFN20981.1 hypothetical protein Bmnpvzhejianggp008 [Bombyx mori nucleopolyhedrovirus]